MSENKLESGKPTFIPAQLEVRARLEKNRASWTEFPEEKYGFNRQLCFCGYYIRAIRFITTANSIGVNVTSKLFIRRDISSITYRNQQITFISIVKSLTLCRRWKLFPKDFIKCCIMIQPRLCKYAPNNLKRNFQSPGMYVGTTVNNFE